MKSQKRLKKVSAYLASKGYHVDAEKIRKIAILGLPSDLEDPSWQAGGGNLKELTIKDLGLDNLTNMPTDFVDSSEEDEVEELHHPGRIEEKMDRVGDIAESVGSRLGLSEERAQKLDEVAESVGRKADKVVQHLGEHLPHPPERLDDEGLREYARRLNSSGYIQRLHSAAVKMTRRAGKQAARSAVEKMLKKYIGDSWVETQLINLILNRFF